MAKFEVGDKIALDYDCNCNKRHARLDPSTEQLLKYLDSHQNIFTVAKVRETGIFGGLVYLEELEDWFFTVRFKLLESPSFNATEQDLESLLND